MSCATEWLGKIHQSPNENHTLAKGQTFEQGENAMNISIVLLEPVPEIN